MLYLVKAHKDPVGERLEKKLKDECLAFRVLDSDIGESYLRENNQVIKGEAAIDAFLVKYVSDAEYARSISADACYRDPDSGEIC